VDVITRFAGGHPGGAGPSSSSSSSSSLRVDFARCKSVRVAEPGEYCFRVEFMRPDTEDRETATRFVLGFVVWSNVFTIV
jgi:hypothetical protein